MMIGLKLSWPFFFLSIATGFLVWRTETPNPTLHPDDPRSYEARRTAAAIEIDGKLDEAAWRLARWTSDFVDIRGGDRPAPPLRTRAKLLWDDRALYVAAELEEPHLWATLTEADDIVWRDDDFEVFLDPDGDGLDYFEVEINAYGTVLDLFLERPYDEGGSAEIEWDLEGMRTAVNLQGTLNDPADRDEGWTVEMAVPWAGLSPPSAAQDPGAAGKRPALPEVGEVWRANFSRVDWPLLVRDDGYVKERELVDWSDHPEENWVWSPQGQINMHAPETWGFLRFAR